MDKLTNEMIKDLAIRLGLEPALLKAVQLVEAAGRDGFLADGKLNLCQGISYVLLCT